MRIFNKLVVVALILAALPVGTLFLTLPDTAALAVADALTLAAERAAALGQSARLVLAVVALALDVFLFWLLYMELRRKPSLSARVSRVQGGDGEVTLEAVHQRVHYHVSQLQDVVGVEPHVSARGGRVSVKLDVTTSPHVNVRSKIDEITQVVREAVTGSMGLRLLGNPSVSIRHVAYGETPPPPPAVSATSPGSPTQSMPADAASAEDDTLKKPGWHLPKLRGQD